MPQYDTKIVDAWRDESAAVDGTSLTTTTVHALHPQLLAAPR